MERLSNLTFFSTSREVIRQAVSKCTTLLEKENSPYVFNYHTILVNESMFFAINDKSIVEIELISDLMLENGDRIMFKEYCDQTLLMTGNSTYRFISSFVRLPTAMQGEFFYQIELKLFPIH